MKNSFKMVRFALCVLLLCGVSFTTFAAPKLSSNYRNFAPGVTFPGHLQGIAADESGALMLTAKVYSYDLYDMVDIAMLAVGDSIR